ncbi:hypothetical protein CABS01_16911 [Colletotrichum abscissum]|uniref:Uncharacterized protein n=1 Tax=Colletotrichum abscissum TaxID=1671311 RepID=A0A9Q0B1E6_9PEZI|nr:uncharacterized protein CABS01_16911 [Colletotrichum abscissum]KAI3547772.1 hypothetical protein CABS02_08584 [Colletotrichum abscissum]KAK1504347.1 hypothetical protein CABS01_16911 [Colletotrichum abscissum]
MGSKLHSVFSPLRIASSSETPHGQRLPQEHVSTFLLCDSDEDSDSIKKEKGLVQGDSHQGTSFLTSIASPDIAAGIKTVCSAAARHPTKNSETMSSYRVTHVYGKASTERSLHLRTASRDGAIITNSFDWNPNDPHARSAEYGIPRPDSPTI